MLYGDDLKVRTTPLFTVESRRRRRERQEEEREEEKRQEDHRLWPTCAREGNHAKCLILENICAGCATLDKDNADDKRAVKRSK